MSLTPPVAGLRGARRSFPLDTPNCPISVRWQWGCEQIRRHKPRCGCQNRSMKPRKYLSEKGPQPEKGRATLGTLACRYDAVDEAQAYRSRWLRRAASDRQAHDLSEVWTPLAGSGVPSAVSSGRNHRHHWAGNFGDAAGVSRLKKPGREAEANGNGVATIEMPSNNGMQLTKAARCAPFSFRSWGQSLRAAFAADLGCYPGGAMLSL